MRLGPFIFRSKISYSANSLSVFLRLGLMDLSAGLSTFDAACFIRCLRVLVSFSWRMGKDAGFPLTPAGMTGGLGLATHSGLSRISDHPRPCFRVPVLILTR